MNDDKINEILQEVFWPIMRERLKREVVPLLTNSGYGDSFSITYTVDFDSSAMTLMRLFLKDELPKGGN